MSAHLPGSDKYRVSDEQEKASQATTNIERANAAVPILSMLWALGCNIPSEVEKSWKFWCPFGAEHSDQGKSKAARYYPETNTAFCFDGHDALTPVKLVAMQEDLSYEQAAQKILEENGLLKPHQSYQERFAEIRAEKEHKTQTYDTSYAVQAFREWLKDQEGYSKRQYDVDIREAFVYSVTVLQELAEPTPERQSAWLKTAKQVMTKVLEKGRVE